MAADNVVFEVKDKAKKLERWVRNTLSGASEIEIKVKEATNNDKWGPTGKQMQEVAGATYNFEFFDPIMKTIWTRLNDNGKYWRHVYKGLLLLEYLLKNGSEQVVRACHSNVRSIQTLTKFQYVTPKGKDEGENIRNRAKIIVDLLGDESRIREERKKAAETRKRFGVAMSSEGGSGSSFGGGSGGYEDDYSGSYGGGSSYGGNDDYGSKYQDEKPYSNERKPSASEKERRYSDDEEQYKKPVEKKTSEKKPRPPSTEIKNEAVATTTNTPAPAKPSLIELFDMPATTTTPTTNQGNSLFFQQNTMGGGFQTQNTMGGGFQQNTMGGGFQTQPTTGFGQFQTASTGANLGGFQTQNTMGGGFQTQPTTGFGQFQSGSSSDFDAFNPRGNTTTTLAPQNTLSPQNTQAFANFESPNVSFTEQTTEKKPAFEGSHLVNLNNLIEDPSAKQSSQQEKKTLGQTLQQKQTTKPVMQGGVLTPTTTIGATPMVQQPMVGVGMGGMGGMGGVGMTATPVINPLAINPQNLTPQQLQQLQLQYQMQLLALQQQQQLQGGGRGF